MTSVEFDRELARLCAEFKPTVYSATKAALIWQMASGLPLEVFSRVVTGFIAGSKHLPLVKEFAEALRPYQGQVSENAPATGYTVECDLCGDLGVVNAQANAYAILALCSCAYGQKQEWRLPTYAELPSPKAFARLPAETFNPNIPRTAHGLGRDAIRKAEQVAAHRVNQKVRWWREKVRIAEQLWANLADATAEAELET